MSLKQRFERYRRIRAEERQRRNPPHRPRLEAALEEYLGRFSKRARRRAVRALVDRLLDLEPTPVPLLELNPPEANALIAARLLQATVGIGGAIADAQTSLSRLMGLMSNARPARQEALIHDYLQARGRRGRELVRGRGRVDGGWGFGCASSAGRPPDRTP